jgi:FkbH-like protein
MSSELTHDQPLHRRPFATAAGLAQRLRDRRGELRVGRKLLPRRVAVLGGFTTSFVMRLLDLFLFEAGVDAELYESPYGTWIEQVLNPDSELYAFAPEVTLLLVSRDNLYSAPAPLTPVAELQQLARSEAERFHGYAALIESRLKTRVILSNFELPSARALGHYEAARGPLGFTRAVNAALAAQPSSSIVLFDLDYLSASFGLQQAVDTKAWCLTKQPFSFDFLVPYCHSLARTVALTCGLSKKCVVLDLDGTIWGGTLAEDGAEQLLLGPDSAEGQAFLSFQHYLKRLKERGVLLAVCSKNEESTARRAFDDLPHMQLKAADIACFVANWQNKASNLMDVAARLQIGLDSLVFVDNSAEERHLIRQQLPEVAVVELPEDPAEYVRALDECGYFELAELSEESVQRTQSLLQEREREQVQARSIDYPAYLSSLQLRAQRRPILGSGLERCAELILRSNQFNLRTVRHSQTDLRALLAHPDNLGFCISLSDRFGAYGIISVIVLERQVDALFIDTWLMSCRVLKKGVEALVFEEIVREARLRGVSELRAEYLPTAKNGMVAELLPSFGFVPTASGGQRLRVADARLGDSHFIAVERFEA